MPLKTIRSKIEKASQQLETLIAKARKSRAPTSECVLVVYERQEASIYYEGEPRLPKPSR